MRELNGTKEVIGVPSINGTTWILSDPRVDIDQSEKIDGNGDEVGDRKQEIEEAVRSILTNVGEDAEREGLQRTPHRVAKMYDELLAGYDTDPVKLVNAPFLTSSMMR